MFLFTKWMVLKKILFWLCIFLFPGQTEPRGLCAAGYVCVSAANNSRPLDGITGFVCQPGYYCPEGSAQGTKCPQGTFSNDYGLHNVSSCQDCTTGTYCQTEGKYSYWTHVNLCVKLL